MMETIIDRRDDTLVITSEYRHHEYNEHEGYREMSRMHHGYTAMQALHAAMREGARFIEAVETYKYYFDAVTARKDCIVLCTVFRMRYP